MKMFRGRKGPDPKAIGEAQDLMTEAMRVTSQARRLPEEVCNYIVEAHHLSAMVCMARAKILLTTNPSSKAVLEGVEQTLMKGLRSCEDHVVADHMEEGDLAELIPDNLGDFPGWKN